jgi:vacuolar iron transporter family protein
MKKSFRTGFSFGLTSGIITTLGLMIGLTSGTQLRLAVLGGILTIAVADSFSDALGIHISEEAENEHTNKEIWESTITTFLTKFIFTLSFVPAIVLWPLNTAVIVNIVWGLSLITIASIIMAKNQKENWLKVVLEHLFIAILVIIATNFLGSFIARHFS